MHLYRRLALVGLLAFLATLYRRAIHFDDPWFMDQAWFIATEGKLRTQLFAHFLGWDQWIYVSQKAHVCFTALFVALLGPTASAARVPALFYGAALLVAVGLYARRSLAKETVWLCFALIVIHRSFASAAFICRGDLAVAALGFGSFVALTRDRPRLAGALAGLSPVFHLNGVVFVVAGFLVLVWRDRSLKRAWGYGVVAASAASVVVWDALFRGELSVLLYQFQNDPAAGGSRSLAAKLANIAIVHQLFFHTAVHAALTVWVILSLVLIHLRGAAARVEKDALLVPYFVSLALSFILLLNRVTVHYYVLFLPFFAVIVVSAHKLPSRIWRFVGLAFVIVALGANAEMIKANLDAVDISARTDMVLASLETPPRRLIGPSTMLIDHAGDYELTSLFTYQLFDPRRGSPWTLDGLFDDAAVREVDYVIFDPVAQAAMITPPLPPPPRFKDYELASWADQFFVYRRRAARRFDRWQW